MSDVLGRIDIVSKVKAAHPGKGRYTPQDRYRDFRHIFLGSDQGQRVLCEILNLGYVLGDPASSSVYDTNKTFTALGAQKLATLIFNLASVEPQAEPKRRQTSQDPGEG